MYLLQLNISLIQILIPILSAALGVFLNHHFGKPKMNAEVESFVVKTMRDTLEEVRKEREDDRVQMALNEQKIRTIQENHENCEFEHSITRLQLNKALKKLDLMHWVRSTVFVLDDNEIVMRVFSHRFRTIPVVNFKAFTNADECLTAAQRERPEILVLDYVLSSDKTAMDIIDHLGYEPEIFIMSGNKDYEIKFKDTGVRFYFKDNNYVRNITKAILEHLTYRNEKT